MTEDKKAGEQAQIKPKKPSNWADDQKDRGYYYDDAHGYETYEPGEDEEVKENDENDASA